MIETLRMLGDYAAERRLRIGIETMQPNSVRDYVDLIGETNHPAVGATIDTGHIRGSADIGALRERRNSNEARAHFNNVLNTLAATLQESVLHFHLSDVEPVEWFDHKTNRHRGDRLRAIIRDGSGGSIIGTCSSSSSRNRISSKPWTAAQRTSTA